MMELPRTSLLLLKSSRNCGHNMAKILEDPSKSEWTASGCRGEAKLHDYAEDTWQVQATELTEFLFTTIGCSTST